MLTSSTVLSWEDSESVGWEFPLRVASRLHSTCALADGDCIFVSAVKTPGDDVKKLITPANWLNNGGAIIAGIGAATAWQFT